MSSIQKHADKDNVVIDYVVRVERLYKDYLLGTQRVPALKNVSLVVRPGEFLAIAGPSGSGKTTLLNIIGCLDSPTEGNIYIRDAAVSEMSEDSLARIRSQRIGFIFQTFNLMPVLTAAENVEYPLLNRAIARRKRREIVEYFLRLVGLEDYMGHRPNEMSGGQRQRVAIARALAVDPSIILADEPTANLDTKTGQAILDLMREINELQNTTFIFSTHDPKVISMAKRTMRIASGEISNSGYDFSPVKLAGHADA
ncbi:MAG: putative ABC transport system ATP-binding protein [Gammaproteobacteria bacterium]|jgi:putative ABC transport system ATP-binding protein